MEFKLRSDGVNILAKAVDAAGKPMELPAKIMFYPQFFNSCEIVRLGMLEVLGVNGDVRNSVFRAALDIPGRTGKLRMPRVEASSAVLPAFATEERVPPQTPPPAKDS